MQNPDALGAETSQWVLTKHIGAAITRSPFLFARRTTHESVRPTRVQEDRIDAYGLAELSRRDLVPAILLADPDVRGSPVGRTLQVEGVSWQRRTPTTRVMGDCTVKLAGETVQPLAYAGLTATGTN